MALEIRGSCGRCSTALARDAEAYFCTFECTFCSICAEELLHVCPNCSGELVRRPRPAPA